MSNTESVHLDREIILSYVRRFFYSNFYLLMLLVISFVPWFFKASLVGIYLLIAVGTISLIVNKDITPSLFMIPLMLVTTSTADFLDHPANFNSLIVAAVLFSVALIVHIVIYRQHMRTGRLTLPLIFVTIAMFIGGIGSEYYTKLGDFILFVISLGPLMLALYHIGLSCMDMPRDVNRRIYFAKIIALFGIIAALQVLVVRLRLEGDFLENLRNGLYSGWGNRNGFGSLILLGLGTIFYWADNARYGNFIIYNLGFALYLALLCTISRAAIIFGVIEMLAITIFLFVKGKHKIQFGIVLVMWIVGVTVTVHVLWQYFDLIFEQLKDVGLNPSGRFDLFKEAWQLFLDHPIFGVGFGYYGTHVPTKPPCIYWFHDTPLQVLASMGIFGAVVYLGYYFARAKMWLSHVNSFTVLSMFSILGFEGQALLDVGPFSSIPFLYLAVLLELFGECSGIMDDADKQSDFISGVNERVDAFMLGHTAV